MDDRLKDIPSQLLFALLNNPYESLILVDAEGVVRFVSESNATIDQNTTDRAIGHNIAEVNPDSGLLRTIQTGKAEIGRSLVLNDQERIVARIPLVQDGKVVGAAGKLLISSPEKLKALYQQIESLETQLDYYKSEMKQISGACYTFDQIIGHARPLYDALIMARKAARNDSPVIITGESGTGKEMFAHAIHEESVRSKNTFVRINCGAIPGDLIEAELFGYEPGAFTGARRKGATGKIELAHNGTLFLDEISEMPLRMQVKLLRVLQDKVVERIGGGRPRQINFRIISATNQDLEELIRKGAFRLDLFYRLNVMTIHLPPLRSIFEDIPLIFNSILNDLAVSHGREPFDVHDDVLPALMAYDWPGNIRELRNVAERAMIVCEGRCIKRSDLPARLQQSASPAGQSSSAARPLKVALDEAERLAIESALHQSRRNKALAAKILGIHRTGLYQKMRKHGML